MRRAELSISDLPAWCKLNDVTFFHIDITDLGTKGYGLSTKRALPSPEQSLNTPSLLIIPNDLVLSREAVTEYIKVDQHLRQLLEVAGGKVC